MLNKRTHIMLEDKTFELLTLLAGQKETSVGELVRRAVKKIYIKPQSQKLAQRQQAYKQLLAWQNQVGFFKHLDYKALIEHDRSR